MYRYVRVEATDLENESAPLFVDLLIDGEGRAKPGMLFVGWWGNHKSTAVLPFIVKRIDEAYYLDFGSYEETPQSTRYEAFNLLHGKIEVGKRFKQRYSDDWYSFRIKRIIDMILGQEV